MKKLKVSVLLLVASMTNGSFAPVSEGSQYKKEDESIKQRISYKVAIINENFHTAQVKEALHKSTMDSLVALAKNIKP